MTRILVITDSRGKNIKPHLQENTPEGKSITWDVQVLPGATIETILKRIERGKRRNHWHQIIVIAGICNITRRITSGSRNYLEYKIRKVRETIEAIDQLLDIGEEVNICTITPASLKDYSSERENDPDLTLEQQQLEQDIEEINQHIIARNINKDSATINLAKLAQIRTLKKRSKASKRIIKFDTQKLRDGVHPTSAHLQEWANYICSMIPKITKNSELSEDETSEEEQGETWNFKRQRRQ